MQYKVGKMLGKGAFGEVFMAQDNRGRTVALKKLTLQDDRNVRAANRELEPLLRLGQRPHEHILPLLNYFHDNNYMYLYLVLEYCHQGTLNDLLLRQSWNETIELRLMAEIADGVSFLHANSIVHRDLKPDNILIAGTEKNPVAKVGDFGLAKLCRQGKESGILSDASNYYMYTGCGTRFFMAPEIFNKHYTRKCDVFSMGVIFVAMVDRTTVKSPSSKSKFVAFLTGPNGNVPIGIAQNQCEDICLRGKILKGLVEQPFKNLCFSMLNKDHEDRPSASAVLGEISRVDHLVLRRSTHTDSQVPDRFHNSQVTHRPRNRSVPNRSQHSPVPDGPQHSQVLVPPRRTNLVILVGAVTAGAMVGYSCGGAWGVIGGALLGLVFGIVYG